MLPQTTKISINMLNKEHTHGYLSRSNMSVPKYFSRAFLSGESVGMEQDQEK